MPVLTRSQTRALKNAPKVPVLPKLEYPCYYKNFLITNEDMKKQVDAFYLGQIDKLDYPLVYKGFTITNNLAMKKRVDDFYDGLGKNYPTRDNKIIQYLRKYEHYEFPLLDPPSNLENLITYLYGFDEYWKEVDDIIVRIMNGENIYENQLDKYLLWNRLMRNSFVKLLGNLMDKFYKINSPVRQANRIKQIQDTLIRFERVFQHKYIGLANGDFFKAQIQKNIELINENGFECAFYTFAFFFPDMVVPECYPTINFTSSLYNNRQTSILETDRTIWHELRERFGPLYFQFVKG